MTENVPWRPDVEDIRLRIQRTLPALQTITAVEAEEEDTRALIADMLCYVLGYDRRELRIEYMLPGGLIDFGVRVGARTYWFLEVKPVGHYLQASDLEAVEERAAIEKVRWAVLTNGSLWQIYYLTPGGTKLATEVDLLSDESDDVRKAQIMAMLHREYVWRLFDDLVPPEEAYVSHQKAPRRYVPVVTAPIQEPEEYHYALPPKPDIPVSISGVSVIVPTASNARLKPNQKRLIALGVTLIGALAAFAVYVAVYAALRSYVGSAAIAGAGALLGLYFLVRLAKGSVSKLFYSRPKLFTCGLLFAGAGATVGALPPM